MSTKLAPVDSREVVRCDRCLLVQFRPENNTCRRCHASLDEENELTPMVDRTANLSGSPPRQLNLATAIRSLRLRCGLSQRELAARMDVPRAYIHKIENEKATPSLSSLERIARGLEVTVPELLSDGERRRHKEISELMEDQFVLELMPLLENLDRRHMSNILTQVRDLTLRARGSF